VQLESLAPGEGPAAEFRLASERKNVDLGQSLRDLTREASALLNRRRDGSLQLAVAGWQWKRSNDRRRGDPTGVSVHLGSPPGEPPPVEWRMRPVLMELSYRRSLGRFETQQDLRHWYVPKFTRTNAGVLTHELPVRLVVVPDVPDSRIDPLCDALFAEARSPRKCADIMIREIRDLARTGSGRVGPDCMLVYMRRQRGVEVAYAPSERWVGVTSDGDLSNAVPATFSPLMLSSTGIVPPSVTFGGTSVVLLEGIPVIVRGSVTPRESGTFAGHMSQVRRPGPSD
jgi:hypothetical protein